MEDIKELAQKERQEYFRNWRKQNPDKVKKHNENYWMRKAAQRVEEQKRSIKHE